MTSDAPTQRNDIPFPIALGLIAFLAMNATAVCLVIVVLAGAGLPGW